MKPQNKANFYSVKTLFAASLLALSGSVLSAGLASTVDDFSHATDTNTGIARMSINDTTAGGKTTTEIAVADGVIKVSGEVVPPRGQPGWSSLVLPLGPMDKPQDASQFSGIKMKVKINNGNVSISANSALVTNYDYHAAPVVVNTDGKFHEVKIPFESMKRAWSEQTKLDTKTLNSLSIVAFSMRKAAFDFEVDEVSFY